MSRRYRAQCRVTDEQIIAGVKLWMTCYSHGEELQYGGSDNEIAQILHNAYVSRKKSNIIEKCEALVFINDRFINVHDLDSCEVLLVFRLIDVRDVTQGQDCYSNFSVLVAKECDDDTAKAYTFYNDQTPACFYNVITTAFRLGFDALNGRRPSACQDSAAYNSKQTDRLKNYANYGLCCQPADISDSEDEIEIHTDQTGLLHSHNNLGTFQNKKQTRVQCVSRFLAEK